MGDGERMRATLRGLTALEGPFEPFLVEAAPEAPRALFEDWLEAAIAAGFREPHAMTLSSVDAEGRPDARVLILKGVDARGWHFAISSESRKGRQIAARPAVALTFYWRESGRQVRIRGRAVELDDKERADDFLARSPSARAGAMIGRQSDVLAGPDALETALAAEREKLAREPDRVFAGWRAYAVEAEEVEFWQGATDRQHVRLRYRRDGAGWIRERLWP